MENSSLSWAVDTFLNDTEVPQNKSEVPGVGEGKRN